MRRGRKKINIDIETFEKLCKMQCTENEICSWFSCSDETLNSWCKRNYGRTFQQIYSEKRESGKISLRRTQWKLAESSAAMAIFLGKNYLGQTDDPRKYEREETTEDKIDRFIDTLTDAMRDRDNDDDGD